MPTDSTAPGEALLPGFSSYGWRFLVTVSSVVVAVTAVIAMIAGFVGAGSSTTMSAVALAALIVFAVGVAMTLLALWLGARRERAERAAGYSTAFDVPGLALRHPRTGVVVRAPDASTGDLAIRRAQWRRTAG